MKGKCVMNIDVFNTHIVLSPYNEETSIPMLEDMYTAEDKFTMKPMACGYLIDDGKLYLPRGTPLGTIENLLKVKANHNHRNDPCDKMSKKYSSLYEPRNDLQKESIAFLTEGSSPQLSLNLIMGEGKALPINAKIPTPKGFSRLKDLEVGDRVFDENGKPTDVIGVYDQGERNVYKVTFSDGRSSVCDLNHLWQVNVNGKDIVLTLTEIMRDYKTRRYTIPLLSSAVEYDSVIGLTNSYQIGLYLEDTQIPYKYRYDTALGRMALIKGIITSRGDIIKSDDKTFIVIRGCREFLKDVQEVIRSLGYNAILGNDTLMAEYEYTTDFIMKPSAPFIMSIYYYGKDKCRCIKVANDSGLFLTECFVVTHNTFVSCYAATQLNEKTLVVTHSEGIKKQWINTFHQMFDYRPKNLLNIAGSGVMEAIMNNEAEEADVYFANHQTLRSYLSQYNGYSLHKFFKKLKIGIKIYDESHLEFANILLMDFFSNTKRTWYLSATFDRSDKGESRCFKQAFSSVDAFGERESRSLLKKHVKYHVVNINSRASPKDKGRMFGFRGMTTASYGQYAFIHDTKQTAYNTILLILDKIKEVEGKTLIFVPLIDVVDTLVMKLKNETNKSVAAYHSKISKDEKEDALKKDIIVSTIKSMGVGKDLPGLRCVICVEPIASKVIATQMIGRLRPYKDLPTYFFDIVDTCIQPINWWFRARMKAIPELAEEIIYLNMDV